MSDPGQSTDHPDITEPESGGHTETPDAGGWNARSIYALAFLTLIYAFNTADRNVFGLLMPLLKTDMKVSDTVLGLMSGFAFSLFYATVGVPVAFLSDRWSRRNIIAIGFTVWSLMTVLTGFVRNAWQLAFARFMLGAGEAGGLAPSNSMIGDLFDRRRRPFALSVMNSANSLGILVAFPVVGWIASHHGWRTAFIAAGLPGLAMAAVFFFTVREPERGRFDGKPQEGLRIPAEGFLQTMARLFSTRTYLLAVLASGLVGIALSGVQTWLPTFLMRVHHLDAQDVGRSMGFIRGLAGICGAIGGGLVTTWLAKRDDRWLVWAPALFMALIAASEFLLLTSPSELGWKVGMGLDTFFTSAQVGPVFGLLLAGADARSRAVATAGALLVLNLFGLTCGPLLVGVLNDALHPSLGDGAIRYSMMAAASASVLASLVCLAIGRTEPTHV